MNWQQVAWVATAIGTMGTLTGILVSLRRNRKDELARRISTEVEAKIGNVLINLRGLEDEVNNRLAGLIADIETRRNAFADELNSRETAMRAFLDRAGEAATQIDTLLKRAEVILPAIEHAELVPFQLYVQARDSTNQSEVAALLVRILEHPESEPTHLELSGDMARERLNNRSLARKLYQRAVDIDPRHLSAKSELLRLVAADATQRESCRDELIALARANPNHRTLVNNAINLLIDYDEWDAIIELAEGILAVSKLKATLWRNIAVARENLGLGHELVSEAYERAFALSGAATSTIDRAAFVNTARPYIRYLISRGDLGKAEEVLTDALVLDPSEAQLHNLRGELFRKRGDYAAAKESFELVKILGDPVEVSQAARALRDMDILSHLKIDISRVGSAGALSSGAPVARVLSQPVSDAGGGNTPT